MSHAAKAHQGQRATHNESAAHQDSEAANTQAGSDNLPSEPADNAYFWAVVITGLIVLAGLSARATGWLPGFGG